MRVCAFLCGIERASECVWVGGWGLGWVGGKGESPQSGASVLGGRQMTHREKDRLQAVCSRRCRRRGPDWWADSKAQEV